MLALRKEKKGMLELLTSSNLIIYKKADEFKNGNIS